MVFVCFQFNIQLLTVMNGLWYDIVFIVFQERKKVSIYVYKKNNILLTKCSATTH